MRIFIIFLVFFALIGFSEITTGRAQEATEELVETKQTETSLASLTPDDSNGRSMFVSSPTASRTRTVTKTRSPTLTATMTPTPTPGPVWLIGKGISTIFLPKRGYICFGERVGQDKKVIVEFLEDINSGIVLREGGCFSEQYNVIDVVRYLENREISYVFSYLPKATKSPTVTKTPSATIIPALPISYISGKHSYFSPIEENTICWADKIMNYRNVVIKFIHMPGVIEIENGACHIGMNVSAEDVYNYLRKKSNYRVYGFRDYP